MTHDFQLTMTDSKLILSYQGHSLELDSDYLRYKAEDLLQLAHCEEVEVEYFDVLSTEG